MYWFKDIQALQLRHDKQHERKDKGNRNLKVDMDTSCGRCFTAPKVVRGQFNNFLEIFTEYTYAKTFSGKTIKIFERILQLDIEKEEKEFSDQFERLIWSFRYEKDFEKQNGELKNVFITTMILSEKFNYGKEETRKRMRAHYEMEFKNLEEKEKAENSNDKEKQFTGMNSERSYHGSITSENEIKMVSIITTSENTARLLVGGNEFELKQKHVI